MCVAPNTPTIPPARHVKGAGKFTTVLKQEEYGYWRNARSAKDKATAVVQRSVAPLVFNVLKYFSVSLVCSWSWKLR